MTHLIEIASVWEDSSLFEVRVRASNGQFSGEALCYTTREEVGAWGDKLLGFPRATNDKLNFGTYGNDTHSFFTLAFGCTDGSGHVNARVLISEIEMLPDSSTNVQSAELDLEVEPAAIDIFARGLQALSKSKLGEVRANLKGKT